MEHGPESFASSNLQIFQLQVLVYQLAIQSKALYKDTPEGSATSSPVLKEKTRRLQNGIIIPDNEDDYPDLAWLFEKSEEDFIDSICGDDERVQYLFRLSLSDNEKLAFKMIILNNYTSPRPILFHLLSTRHGLDLKGNAVQDLAVVLDSQEGSRLVNLCLQHATKGRLFKGVVGQLDMALIYESPDLYFLGNLRQNIDDLVREFWAIRHTSGEITRQALKPANFVNYIYPGQIEFMYELYDCFGRLMGQGQNYRIIVDDTQTDPFGHISIGIELVFD